MSHSPNKLFRKIYSSKLYNWMVKGIVLAFIFILQFSPLNILGESPLKDIENFIESENPIYVFAQISDPQIGSRSEVDDERYFNKVIDEINKLKINRVFITGDLVNHNIETEWNRYAKSIKRLNATVHSIPGNHDVLYVYNKFVEKVYREKDKKYPEKATLARELFKKTEAEINGGALSTYIKYTGEKRAHYTVEVEGNIFITIPTLTTRIEEEDLKWLEEELEKTKDASHVFILAHYPVLNQFGRNVQENSGGKIFLALLKKYKVAGFLVGHRHRLLTAKVDETMHIVCPQPKQGYFIYLIFKNAIKAIFKTASSADFQSFTFKEPRSNQ